MWRAEASHAGEGCGGRSEVAEQEEVKLESRATAWDEARQMSTCRQARHKGNQSTCGQAKTLRISQEDRGLVFLSASLLTRRKREWLGSNASRVP
eukprot:5350071-Pleurochrysis_carterae.AAC.1